MIGEGGNQVFTISDFSGGVSDYPLDANPRFCAKADNFLVTDENKLRVRYGSELLDPSGDLSIYLRPQGQTGDILGARFNEEDKLFIRVKNRVYTLDSALLEIEGDTGNYALYDQGLGLSEESRAQMRYFNNHLYLTAHEDQGSSDTLFARMQKIYRLTSGAYQVVNAGLPKFPASTKLEAVLLAETVALANEIKANYNTHVANVTIHGSADTAITAADATDFDTLLVLIEEMEVRLNAHMRDIRTDGAPTYHKNPNTRPISCLSFFVSPYVTPVNLAGAAPVLNEMRRLLILHSLDITEYDPNSAGSWPFSHVDGAGAVVPITFTADPIVTRTGCLDADDPVTRLGRFSTLVEDCVTALRTHFLSAGQHSNAYYNTGWTLSALYAALGNGVAGPFDADDSYERIIWLCHALYAFLHRHRADATVYHPGGTETAGSALGGSIFNPDGEDGILTCPNPETAGGLASIAALVEAIRGSSNNIHNHSNQGGTRHNSDVAVTQSYNNFEFLDPIYALTYRYTYQIFTKATLIDESAPFYFSTEARVYEYRDASARLVTGFSCPVTSIPSFNGGDMENYQEDFIKVRVYRQVVGGALYRFVKALPLSATSFTDTLTSEVLDEQLGLYTNGGIVANDPPPDCKAFNIINNTGWYGNVRLLESEEYVSYPSRVMQSVQNDIDSVPESFYLDMPSEVVEIGGVGSVPLLLTLSGLYRIEGLLGLAGGGLLTFTEISSTVRGVSVNSGVTVGDRFFFAGHDGFYMTDGYKAVNISVHLKEMYSLLVSPDSTGKPKGRLIKGVYHPEENRIYWAVAKDGDNYDGMVVLDLNKELGESSCFTLWSGPSFAPSAVGIWQNRYLVRGDIDGYVFSHQEGTYSDPEIDRATGLMTSNRDYIRYEYLSGITSFGSDKIRKWVTEFDMTARALSAGSDKELSLAPYYINDRGRLTGFCREILYSDTRDMLVGIKRHFPRGGLRCMYKQVGLKPANKILSSSEQMGSQVYLNRTLLTVTLDSGHMFPVAGVLGQYWYFSNDGYEQEFRVQDISPDRTTILLADPGNVLPLTGNYDWSLEGYPLEERLEINVINVPFTLYSNTKMTRKEGQMGHNTDV